MIAKKITDLLNDKEFISVATCDFSGRPNVAPKFILKVENNFLYLVDYVMGTTFQNLKVNPRVSLSVMDLDDLIGYQLNGSVEIIEDGRDYQMLADEFKQKEISLSTKRIIESLDTGKSHRSFEIALPEQVVIFKIKIAEVAQISSSGELRRERV